MSRKFVLRKGYLRKLSAFRDNTDFVKIITGVRRCGKSTLMLQFMDSLLSDGIPEDDIIHINLEYPEYYGIRSEDDLASLVFPLVPKNRRTYVFIDEVQRAEGWERVVNALMSGTDADIYITGSNAHVLSSELSTFLTGRYIGIDMLPLSFGEWKELRAPDTDDAAAFRRYIVYGGFPSIDPSAGGPAAMVALRDLYASIVKWDIASRGEIRNIGELDRLLTYLMHNIGNPMSLNNIVKGMGSNRDTVERYLNLMIESFLIYRADRYDIASSALSPSPKYYAVDPGMREMATGFAQKDLGRALENVVYLELLRRGNSVQIGKHGIKEVDFVALPEVGGKEYYQVCLAVSDETVFKREKDAFGSIKDSFPKTILTLDPVVRHATEEGIIVECITDWLLGSEKSEP